MQSTKTAGPLPKDILRLILMLVDDYGDLHHCQLTCKSWRAIIVDNALFVCSRKRHARANAPKCPRSPDLAIHFLDKDTGPL
jgi:hypothetical protein